MNIKKISKTTDVPTLLIRLVAGFTFLSEGPRKPITPEIASVGRFAKIGFDNPSFWAYCTGLFEIVCGVLIGIGLLTRLAERSLHFFR